MRRFVIVALALATLQVTLWLAVGRRGLYRTLPRMIEMDLAAARDATGPSQPDDGGPRSTLVVCEDLAHSLGTPGLAQLHEQLGPLGYGVTVEDAAPAEWRDATGTRPGFSQLCAAVTWSTPVVANVEVVLWQGGLAAHGEGHRAWFLLGRWLPAPAHSVWVS